MFPCRSEDKTSSNRPGSTTVLTCHHAVKRGEILKHLPRARQHQLIAGFGTSVLHDKADVPKHISYGCYNHALEDAMPDFSCELLKDRWTYMDMDVTILVLFSRRFNKTHIKTTIAL